ncbi:MAG: hypothetical protein Q9221_006710 [Calogaya cf. arnoldii]
MAPRRQCARLKDRQHSITTKSQAANNTLTGVKKRAAKEGKAKDRGEDTSRPSFPFIKLVLELRREVYKLVLPQQESRPKQWAKIENKSNHSTSLLLASKQVSEEAQDVLYGLNAFTLAISDTNALWLDTFTEFDLQLGPIKVPLALPHIKNWQISLWPQIRICRFPDRGRNRPSIEDVHNEYIDFFSPFNYLRFKCKVEIITITKPARQYWDDPHFTYAAPSRFPHIDNKNGYKILASYDHQQCQSPRCLSFAASFGPFLGTFMGTTTPLAFTKSYTDWFDLKKRAHRAYTQYFRDINVSSGNLNERLAWITKGNNNNDDGKATTRFAQVAMHSAIAEATSELPHALLRVFDGLSAGSDIYFNAMFGAVEKLLKKLADLEDIE